MKRNPFVMLMLALIFLTATSCKKKETEPDFTSLLVAHSWKVDKVLAYNNPVTDETIQLYSGQDGAQLLGVLYNSDIVFKNDGTYVATDRKSTQPTTGTWALTSKDQKTYLTINSDGVAYEFEVATLTTTKLSVTRNFDITKPLQTSIPVQLDLVSTP